MPPAEKMKAFASSRRSATEISTAHPLSGSSAVRPVVRIASTHPRPPAADGELERESEARYRGLLEAAPDAMVVVNQAGEIVLLNLQAEKQFGYSRDELVGQAVTNIIPEGFAERLIADDLRSTADALAQVIGTGIELVARRRDGTEFPIEIMLSPLENAEGILVTAAIRDISVRKAAEEHLAHLAALVESSDDAILSKSLDGTILSWNRGAEKLYGYTAREVVGRPISLLLPTDRPREVADMLEHLRRGEEIDSFETARVTKDGSVIQVSLRMSPIRGTSGEITGASTIARDITARKDAEATLLLKVQELARSNEELGQFAYIASHDLQEPLRMVASYTELLARRYKGRLDSDADEFIAFAVDGANRMQRLIEDLLMFSRVGTRGTDLLGISSEEALQQALINLRGSIEESGAVVTHDLLPEVLADETQLIQLFQNLVGNAVKYRSSAVPRVNISAAIDGQDRWSFAVADNGLGIEPQYFEKIFGMFQRLHKREEYAGTGIGLAVCKKIVERHGGGINVESRPGQGSTFTFTLARSGVEP
jgi:PAS domain S-box-containing protein